MTGAEHDAPGVCRKVGSWMSNTSLTFLQQTLSRNITSGHASGGVVGGVAMFINVAIDSGNSFTSHITRYETYKIMNMHDAYIIGLMNKSRLVYCATVRRHRTGAEHPVSERYNR